jgi:hypothetical protein
MNVEKLKESAILATLSNFEITKSSVDIVGMEIFCNEAFESEYTLTKAKSATAYDFLFVHSNFVKGLCNSAQQKIVEMVGEEVAVYPTDIITYGTRYDVDDLEDLKDAKLAI